MKSPAALLAHLNANLPAAWNVCALPKPLRRRAYGARLLLGDCHLYVAATRRRVDVLALNGGTGGAGGGGGTAGRRTVGSAWLAAARGTTGAGSATAVG